MKTCTKCNVEYPLPLEDFFNRKQKTKDGFQHSCKKCVAEFHKAHYQKRKSYYKKKARKNNKEYNRRNLQYMIDYLKGHPCVDCGENDPIVLEFDHQYGDKEHNVSMMKSHSLKKLKEEISKCIIRCANCHRRRTAKQFGWYREVIL